MTQNSSCCPCGHSKRQYCLGCASDVSEHHDKTGRCVT